MKIGVVGYVVVGKAAVNTLKNLNIKYDKYQDLDSFDNLLLNFVFIIIPTP